MRPNLAHLLVPLQFGEAIAVRKKVELTDEQKAKLEEQRKAFIIVEDKEKKAKGPKVMKDNERIKLLQYTVKVPEALIGYRVLVFLTESLTGTGVVQSCTHSVFKGTSWVIKFEDGSEASFALDILGEINPHSHNIMFDL